MKIVCPQCGFAREVPEDRLPGAAAVATCPQCRHRFKVLRPAGEQADAGSTTESTPYNPDNSAAARHAAYDDAQAPQHPMRPGAPDEDDPLPPGAVIPRSEPEQESRHVQEAAPTGETRRAAPRAAAPAPKPTAEEEEEYRRAAMAAYAQAAQAGQAAADAPLENPWEHPEREGYLAAFYQTTVRVMFAAPRFFAGLKADTPQHKALIFYLLVGLCQILVERIWGDILSSTLAPSAGSDPQLQNLLQMLTPQTNLFMAILLRSAMVTLELFIAAGLYFLIFRLLVPSKANYQLIFQVLAYSSAPALLCIVPVAGSVAGFIWGIACSFVGCRHALGLTWSQTVMGLVPIYAMAIPVLMYLFQSVRAMTG